MIKLKKTKVPMRASEYEIYNLINQFEVRCSSTWCNECRIVKHNKKTEGMDTNECLSRYIYENIIDVE